MSVRPGLRAGHGLIALSAALACSGALDSGIPGLGHKGSRVEELENIYTYIYIYIYEVHAFSRAREEISVYIDGQLVGAIYSEQSMDGINKYDLFG